MESFIVELCKKIINALSNFSLLRIINIILPFTEGYGFIEIWVIGNFFVSIILLYISSIPDISWWEIVILIYAGYRIFEIIIYQINVLLFTNALAGYRRSVILLTNNALEILVWFALFYRNFDYLFISQNIPLDSFFGSIYYSLVTMSTLGFGDIIPKNYYALYIVIPQTLIGIFVAVVIFQRFISFIPKPKTLDEYEKKTRKFLEVH